MLTADVAILGLALAFVANAYFAGSILDQLARDGAPPSHPAWRGAYAHIAIACVSAVAMLTVYVLSRL